MAGRDAPRGAGPRRLRPRDRAGRRLVGPRRRAARARRQRPVEVVVRPDAGRPPGSHGSGLPPVPHGRPAVAGVRVPAGLRLAVVPPRLLGSPQSAEVRFGTYVVLRDPPAVGPDAITGVARAGAALALHVATEPAMTRPVLVGAGPAFTQGAGRGDTGARRVRRTGRRRRLAHVWLPGPRRRRALSRTRFGRDAGHRHAPAPSWRARARRRTRPGGGDVRRAHRRAWTGPRRPAACGPGRRCACRGRGRREARPASSRRSRRPVTRPRCSTSADVGAGPTTACSNPPRGPSSPATVPGRRRGAVSRQGSCGSRCGTAAAAALSRSWSTAGSSRLVRAHAAPGSSRWTPRPGSPGRRPADVSRSAGRRPR